MESITINGQSAAMLTDLDGPQDKKEKKKTSTGIGQHSLKAENRIQTHPPWFPRNSHWFAVSFSMAPFPVQPWPTHPWCSKSTGKPCGIVVDCFHLYPSMPPPPQSHTKKQLLKNLDT